MPAVADPAELALLAPVDYTFELVVEAGLLEPAGAGLARALAGARRALVVLDGTGQDQAGQLDRYLDGLVGRGHLESFRRAALPVVGPARGASALARDELVAIEQVAALAMEAGLARRDVIIAAGDLTTQHLVATAASALRRYTPCVRLLGSLADAIAVLGAGVHVRRPGGVVGASPRRATALLDPARIDCPIGDPSALLLAVLDPALADDLSETPRSTWGRRCAEALPRIARRFAPGSEAWTLGWPATAGPLTVIDRLRAGIEAAGQRGWCGAHRLGTLRRIAGELNPGLRTSTAAIQNTLVFPSDRAPLRANGRPLCSADAEVPEDGPAGGVLVRSTIHKRMTVRIAADLWSDRSLVADVIAGGSSRLLVAVDDFDPAYTARMRAALDQARAGGALAEYRIVAIEPTDQHKNHEQTRRIIAAATEMGLTADDRLVAVGGGTVLDITGYASSLLSVPVPYLRVPTTFVGMIDAAVGLKVGVNLGRHKNLCGAYHPANLAICDLRALDTLPLAEFRCGLAEAIKIAIVCDAELFGLLEANADALGTGTLTGPALVEVVSRSVRAMTGQLGLNPLEEQLRRLPDFGHELGHLFESVTDYRLRHGEAVAIGLAMSTCIGYAARRTDRATRDRVLTLVQRLGLALWHECCEPGRAYRHLTTEVVASKNGLLHLVIPVEIGTGDFIDSPDEISYDHVNAAVHQIRCFAGGTG